MLRITFTKRELDALMENIHFTPMQKRIIQYKLDEESRVKMAEIENVSIATIDREIKKISIKIKTAYENNMIVL
jgi:hypothetical protein